MRYPSIPGGSFIEFKKEEIEQSIPDRFEKIVRMYPEQIAVKTDNQVVTYAELNAMANRVAHAIVAERGNNPEPVAMLLEKGVDQIAAMLGILKAGKYFVLLDPSFPAERISLIIEDSKATLLVVDRKTLSLAQQCVTARCKLIRIDTLAQSIPAQDPRISISPHALACIVYTSGSTGRPKGVIRNHRSLLHGTMLRVRTDGISKNDRLAHITAGTANSVTNSFYVLLQGATLVTFDVKREGVARLASWLIDEKISICLIASPVFRKLCTTLTGAERFADLRYLRLRSDTVYSSDVALHRKHFPPTCLLATGLASSEAGPLREYRIKHDTEFSGSEVPVGYALEGREILLLDEDGKEVGFDEIGEIVVRSEYLSLGYWNDPGLTAEKFRPDSHDPEKRLFYTGDLGLMLPDGCLIHKGRKDFRVKIRGYGVDLIEVEKALRSHGDIKEAVVVAKQGKSGDGQVIAYYALERQPGVTVDELRRFLGATLADYMVPTAFVKLDALPLTSNGKVDRKALPEPSNERPELKEPYQSPRNAIEKALVEIWEGLLDVRPVGVHDNFFDLGGHSLTATRLISQFIRHFEWELPLQQLFRSPTVAEIAAAVDQHRGQKLENNFPIQLPSVSTKPISRNQRLPLAYAQEGFWFLDQLHPGGSTYNLITAYQIKGPLDVSALEKSFNEIIRRHEVLRTVFESVDGSPVQVILPSLAIKIPVLDLQKIASEEDKHAEARRLSREEGQRPFDLARGPLLRIKLLRLAQNDYVLLRAMHHIVFDAWSSGILLRELAQLYKAFSEDRPSPLADLPIQYANYAVWQRQCLEAGALQGQLSYWKKQLANLPALPFPTDKPRPSINKSRGVRQYYEFSKPLSEGLRALSRRHGVTLFTVMLAAFQTLMSRQSGQTDIAIGSAVAGRNRTEFDGLIGYFLNMVVLRADLSGNPAFAEVISRVWKVCLEALSHQDLPFQKLVEELQPARDLSHNPLIQVGFPFQNTKPSSLQLSGVKVSDLKVETGIARFDLQLEMEERGDCLGGFLDYNVDLFNADTIVRMLEHFRILLEGIVTNPDRRIGEFPLLTEPERRAILVEWNDTATGYPQDKCIHQLFEAQVKQTPDAVAVMIEGQQLTYGGLNRRANQLAHHLRKLRVGPEALVGICMERSLEMVVAMLGILKAGGAYVPLDPAYPKERLAFMIEDSGAQVLLTQEHLLPALPDHGVRVVCLDRDREAIGVESEGNVVSDVTSGNLAYVIYTSGSTGTPKGILISHGSIASHCIDVQRHYELVPDDHVLQFASLNFDASVEQILPTLISGGCIVPRDPEVWSITEFIHKISHFGITVANLPTVYFRQLGEEWAGKREPVSSNQLRLVIVGGESMLLGDLKHWRQTPAQFVRLLNAYGPTETTITATTFTVPPQSSEDALLKSIPIGRPLGNRKMYILDRYGSPVPVGVLGELHIGGAALARGYLNRPDLTGQKFIPNPFSDQPGARLYKTGDLACWLPDGNIQFLGRIDSQVKIRGFRIELGEVEAALSQHPAVRETVVLAREEVENPKSETCTEPSRSIQNLNSPEKRLVAYVVSKQEPPPTVSELRSFLKEKLPEYMVPSAFMFLDALPLTPNGKIDCQALPAPDQSRPDLESRFVAPRTPVEGGLAGIWSEVLKLKRVGIHDNFFELGGHSLLATQVMSRVHKTFEVEVPLRSLFENPTIAELAVQIVQGEAKKVAPEDLADILADLESLSDEEAERLLADENI